MDTPITLANPAIASEVASTRPESRRILLCLGLGVFVALSIRNAWMSDDALITMRTVDHFTHGRGLVWNTGERVQAYTHPLWMLGLSVVYAITGEPYFGPITLGILLSAAALVWLCTRLTRSTGALAFVLVCACLSKSLVHYTTSGLENPLVSLLLVGFAVSYLDERRLGVLALFASAIALTRMDTVLLVAPALAQTACAEARVDARRTLKTLALCSLPFVAWEAFSVVYYGFPFPNTAYAKLGSGIAPAALARQGLGYFLSELAFDPLTFVAMLGCLLVSMTSRRARPTWLALGAALYLAYIVRIGGDFMAGRFFTAPFVVMLCAFVACDDGELDTVASVSAIAMAVALGLSTEGTSLNGVPSRAIIDVRGVADERAAYVGATSIMQKRVKSGMRKFRYAAEALRVRADETHARRVVVRGNLGFYGFYVGPGVYVIDPDGLSDPLLARLPARDDPKWRIGHFARSIPQGYVDSVVTLQTRGSATCKMKDPALCELWAKLVLVTRGPLWSAARWAAILDLNLHPSGRVVVARPLASK